MVMEVVTNFAVFACLPNRSFSRIAAFAAAGSAYELINQLFDKA